MKIHWIFAVSLLLIIACKKDSSENQKLETTWILKDWWGIQSSNTRTDTFYMLQNGVMDTSTPVARLSWGSTDPLYELSLEEDRTYLLSYSHDDTAFAVTGNWNLVNNILIIDRLLFSFSVKAFSIKDLRNHEMTLASPDTLFVLDTIPVLGSSSTWRFEEEVVILI